MQGKRIDLSGLKSEIVSVNEKRKTAEIELIEEDLKKVESVRYRLLYFVPRDDDNEKMEALCLGSDNDVEEKRNAGKFKINFSNKKWVTFDGVPLFVQVVSDATYRNRKGRKVSGRDICVSPILLNGQPYKLFFIRKYPDRKVTVIGAVPMHNNKVTLPDGRLESLKKGDVVTPLYFHLKDRQNRIEVANIMGNPITIDDNPRIEMTALPDGIYGYVFEFVNPIGGKDNPNVTTQEGVVCKVKKGKIVKTIHSDDVDTVSDLQN